MLITDSFSQELHPTVEYYSALDRACTNRKGTVKKINGFHNGMGIKFSVILFLMIIRFSRI